MKRKLMAAGLALAIGLSAAPAGAGDTAAEVERLAREAAQTIMTALTVIMAAIPQYEAPKIMENGDIIIRRKNPPGRVPDKSPEPPPNEKGDFDRT